MFINDPVNDVNHGPPGSDSTFDSSTNQKLTYLDNFILIFIIYIYAAIIINYVLSSDTKR